MDLVTSLVLVKRSLNGGTLPPMTAIPESAREFIDSTATPGLGSLTEDEDRGLLCPVKDCGGWYHNLGRHLTTQHADIGGAHKVRSLLSIQPGAPLASQKYRAKKRAEAAARGPALSEHLSRVRSLERLNADRPRAVASIKRAHRSVAAKNLRNQCEEQTKKRIRELEAYLGRRCSLAEARRYIGEGFVKAIITTYGSWNAARALFGLEIAQVRNNSTPEAKKLWREAVLNALRAWYNVHGELPKAEEAQRANRLPLIPTPRTIKRALDAVEWDTAMRRAAAVLNIYGGRYGLPERKEPAA